MMQENKAFGNLFPSDCLTATRPIWLSLKIIYRHESWSVLIEVIANFLIQQYDVRNKTVKKSFPLLRGPGLRVNK